MIRFANKDRTQELVYYEASRISALNIVVSLPCTVEALRSSRLIIRKHAYFFVCLQNSDIFKGSSACSYDAWVIYLLPFTSVYFALWQVEL